MPGNDDLDSFLETALIRADEPLNLAAVIKALPAGKKPKQEEVRARLHGLVDAGRIHRWPGKAEKFAALSAQSLAREQVLRALSRGPLTESEIKGKLPTSLKTLVKSALGALVAEKTVTKHPKLGTRQPFGVGPPAAADYLPAEIAKAFKQLMKLGFGEPELRAALRRYAGGVEEVVGPTDAGAQEILAAMPRLNHQASRGALVYVAELRAALTQRFPDKPSFDRAVLELAEQGKVQLQSHAWPGRLSEGDKQALIPNGHGGFFDAIGLRLE